MTIFPIFTKIKIDNKNVCLKDLKKISQTGSAELKRPAKAALEKLSTSPPEKVLKPAAEERGTVTETDKKPGKGQSHVFISYSSDCTDAVEKIREALLKEKIRCWMAKYDMKGDAYDAMAFAVCFLECILENLFTLTNWLSYHLNYLGKRNTT